MNEHFRFSKIQGPLMMRRSNLEKVKRIHQFMRDVEDEKLWIQEMMPRAANQDYGNSLLSVQLLIKKNHVNTKYVVVKKIHKKPIKFTLYSFVSLFLHH